MALVHNVLYVCYLLSLSIWGLFLVRFLTVSARWNLFTVCSSILLGTMTGVSLTYVLSVLLSQFTAYAIQYSVVVWLVIIGCIAISNRKKAVTLLSLFRISFFDFFAILFSFAASFYIMFKTFRSVSDGSFYIARNVIFDMAHLLSIIRSFSFGDNIPYTSPFVAGTDHIYHFLFPFFASIGEIFHVPLYLAVLVPSCVGMSLLLLLVYACITRIWKLPFTAGFAGIFFMLFQTSLTYIPVLSELFSKQSIFSALWQFPNYRFAGPFDGSVISIFVTLNVFVNQRHIPYVLGLWLVCIVFAQQFVHKNRFVWFGICIGLLVPWHLSLVPFLAGIICLILVSEKQFRQGIVFILGACFGFFPFLIQWLDSLLLFIGRTKEASNGISIPANQKGIRFLVTFIVQNCGFLLLFAAAGFGKYRRHVRFIAIPSVVLFLLVCWDVYGGVFNQKNISAALFFLKLVGVLGVYTMFSYKRLRFITVVLIILTLLSGVFDFLVIKNDFMATVQDKTNRPLLQFISSTPKSSIFLGQEEMFDPITLAGRKAYYGFFKQVVTTPITQRSQIIDYVYRYPDAASEVKNVIPDVDYLIISKEQKHDVPYLLFPEQYVERFTIVYSDNEATVLSLY